MWEVNRLIIMNGRNCSFDLQVPENSLRLLYITIAMVDIVLLSSYLLVRTQLFGPLAIVQAQLDFRHEKVAAVWYSGIVLFLTGMAALLCFNIDSQAESSGGLRNPYRYGWLAIALTFVAFSFDEMGSIRSILHFGTTRLGWRAVASNGPRVLLLHSIL